MIFITHDLGVVSQVCDQVMVMYGGRILEKAPVNELFSNPRHPYTYGLIQSVKALSKPTQDRLYTIPGQVPPLGSFGTGCVFYSRCFKASDACQAKQPNMIHSGNHSYACLHPVVEGE